jgi:hypothetical protein
MSSGFLVFTNPNTTQSMRFLIPYSMIPRRRSASGRWRKTLLLSALATCVLAGASCSQDDSSPYRPTVTDTRPVGQGLKVIGFAMLGAAVVGVLGRMIR